MSYYTQLKKLVLPVLTHYKDDLLKLDRYSLKGYEGSFLYAHRETGTDIFKYDVSNLEFNVNNLEFAYCALVRSENKFFYHGVNSVVSKITREQAIEFFKQFASKNIHSKVECAFNGFGDGIKKQEHKNFLIRQYNEAMR